MTDNYRVWQKTSVARTYLEGVRGSIPLAIEQIDCILRLIRLTRSKVETFLDLGCGNGILGKSIRQQYPDAKAVFLDISETMLEAAKDDRDCQQNTVFIQADFGEKNWIDAVSNYAPFTVIVSGFSIHHQPDDRKQEIYREIYQLLEPHGMFLNLEHIASLSPLGEKAFDELFVDSLYNYHQQQGGNKSREEVDREYYNRSDKTANILAPVDLQCQWLREIGFQDVDCFLKLFEIALFGGIK
jgi:ubiquinone/menaquinone biosynthesis C-methylase UbiE